MNATVYQLSVGESAAEEIKKLNKIKLKAVYELIASLAEKPLPPTVYRLKLDGLYRVRQNDVRIVYSLRSNNVTVVAIKNNHRKVSDAG